ncbi:ROK family transcriptional regulator [Sinomonas sp. JGH33]|uniref:ROK family transcriptional regulator n=1 Tax=Sinomonas terricola TaxID=3110330 RepID=A0ABU5TAH5_9MICC|nr:ROK family transcriptional regulator [Sinomonas sp. JGH33]MEA5456706.1 ROK family transcriptional regulator [Sinomonas sp. JGH33]
MGVTPSGTSRADSVPGRILGLLGTQGPTSRAAIARRLRLSPATVTQVTKDLVANGSVSEVSSVPSNGGRPATLLGLAREGAGAIGVKITAEHVAIVDASIAGEVLRSRTVPFDPSRPDAVDRITGIIRKAVDAHPGLLLGVGVGVPGSVDAQDNGVVTSSMLSWTQMPLGAVLRDALGVPVLVDNDVHAVAAAQLLYGAGREFDSYLVVTIGLGIGCAVVVDRTIYRGAHGGAGEIGHIPVTLDGPLCQCGATGCLEAHIGAPALVREARHAKVIGSHGTIEALQRAAGHGDEKAIAAFRRAGSMLGRGMAGVANTLDPQAIVLLGEGMTAWAHWQPGFDETFRPHLMADRRQIPVIREDWTDDHWALGAAALVMASPFDSDASGAQGGLVSARLQSLQVAAP